MSKTGVGKAGTLAWLVEQFWESEEKGLQALRAEVSAADIETYAYVEPGGGRTVDRTDLPEQNLSLPDRPIRYSDFSAPSLWGSPFSILRVEVDPRSRSDVDSMEYMFHAGEELLYATKGTVAYELLHGFSKRPTPDYVEVLQDSALRVMPQLPHKAWGAGEVTAEAWMFLRYASDSSRSLYKRAFLSRENVSIPRAISLDQATGSSAYAWVAWGLSELLRVNRQRANLSIKQVSSACKVDPALLSRIEKLQQNTEDAKVNISLKTLVRLAEYLELPLVDIIANSRSPYQESIPGVWDEATAEGDHTAVPLFKRARVAEEAANFSSSAPAHQMHTSALTFKANTTVEVPSARYQELTTPVAWVVITGAATLTIEPATYLLGTGEESQGPRRPTISEGGVFHFRGVESMMVKAHADTRILEVTLPHICNCG